MAYRSGLGFGFPIPCPFWSSAPRTCGWAAQPLVGAWEAPGLPGPGLRPGPGRGGACWGCPGAGRLLTCALGSGSCPGAQRPDAVLEHMSTTWLQRRVSRPGPDGVPWDALESLNPEGPKDRQGGCQLAVGRRQGYQEYDQGGGQAGGMALRPCAPPRLPFPPSRPLPGPGPPGAC